MQEANMRASDLIREIRDAFDNTILPRILHADNRIGIIDDKKGKALASGKIIDLRIPAFLAVSGKGGPGHKEYTNVSLFDHASSVAMTAATLAVVDLLASQIDEDEILQAAAVAFSVGLMHDADKLCGKEPCDILIEDICRIHDAYGINAFLNRFGVDLSSEQFAGLIDLDEVRTTDRRPVPRSSDKFLNIVRRHVRFADVIDSTWLKGLPSETVHKVLDAWTTKTTRLFNPNAFSDVRPLIVSDRHHPFLLSEFALCVEVLCERRTGMRPLIHAVRDETLISLLPVSDFEVIIDEATNFLAESVPFQTTINIKPAGNPEVGGDCPSWHDIESIFANTIPTGSLRNILAVKKTDLATYQDEIGNILSSANCPAAAVKPAGMQHPLVSPVSRDSSSYPNVLLASLTAFAIKLPRLSKSQANAHLSRKAREEFVRNALRTFLPDWVDQIHDLTRRSIIAVIAAREAAINQNLNTVLLAEFNTWFQPNGILAGMPDKATPVRNAVKARYLALSHGIAIRSNSDVPQDESAQCLITGEAVSREDRIGGSDGLYGIKTSAISYRHGRSEDRFREIADVCLSPVSYAEYKLKGVIFVNQGKGGSGEIPIRFSSPTAGGVSSLTLATLTDRGSQQIFGLFDMARGDRKKGDVYTGLETFIRRAPFGRFETLPTRFADPTKKEIGRISFMRMAMKSCLRLGRPLHLFSGLPHPRKEYFYCDCWDPDLRILLGKDGFRLEEIEEAISRLEIVGALAKPRADNGLGLPDIAKTYCNPKTRFAAACTAWAVARDRALGNDGAGTHTTSGIEFTLQKFIESEAAKMKASNNLSAPILLGIRAGSIQKRPGGRNRSSARDETFLIQIALDAAASTRSLGMTDETSVIAAVAGRIRTDADRRQDGKGFYSAATNRAEGESLDDAIEKFARTFVEQAWFGIFKGRSPATKDRKTFIDAYRFAFVRLAHNGNNDENNQDKD